MPPSTAPKQGPGLFVNHVHESWSHYGLFLPLAKQHLAETDASNRIAQKEVSMSTMKAVRIRSFGGPDVLRVEDAPRPVPKQDEILVRIRAAGINPVDWKTRRGQGVAGMLERPLPVVLGWDFAGTVVGAGERVTRFAHGDAVYGMVHLAHEGTYAEYVSLPASHAASKPQKLTFEEAAAVPLAALTAWQALFDTARLRHNQKVLVHAAAGGVGHLAVQLAKIRGATVVATASRANHDFVKALGADVVIDYVNERFEDHVRDADVVLDTMGGEIQTRSFATLRKGGTLVSILHGPDAALAARAGVHAQSILVKPNGETLKTLADLMDRGELHPTVSLVYPITAVRDAHSRGELGHTRGKVVLSVPEVWPPST
jgi:NADPH:quinone reductase-like Zn-dependent oxidoreductase